MLRDAMQWLVILSLSLDGLCEWTSHENHTEQQSVEVNGPGGLEKG